MLLRLVGFLSGFPGATPGLCRFLADRLNGGWSPVVPSGPYGASGEIGPLAHLFQTFIGEGFVEVDGERRPAREALDRVGVEPYDPDVKEGVALLNGSPFATALAVRLGDLGARLLDQATVAAALAVALVGASARPFAPRVLALGGDDAARRIGARLVELLGRDELWDERPQPPVSFRVVPQVHGALGAGARRARRQQRNGGSARSRTALSIWTHERKSQRVSTRSEDSTRSTSPCVWKPSLSPPHR